MQRGPFETRTIKNASFEQATSNRCFFKNCYYISFQDTQSFFEFLVSVINPYDINELNLFGDSFEWFCLQISWDAKYFFLSCPKHCDLGFLVVIEYYFQIWNKKESNIIISRTISSHMGPMYIDTPYMYKEDLALDNLHWLICRKTQANKIIYI